MPARDMYADLEKIEARGKRKKDKRKGFFSFGRKEEPQEPEPAPEPAPAPDAPTGAGVEEPVAGPEVTAPQEPGFDTEMEDMTLEESRPVMEPPPTPTEAPDAQIIQTEPASSQNPEKQAGHDDPMDMLEFSESPAEEDNPPEQQPPGTDPFGPQADPAGFSSMPVAAEPEESPEQEEPAQVISLDEPGAGDIQEPVIAGPEPQTVSDTVSQPPPQPAVEPMPRPGPAQEPQKEPEEPVQSRQAPEPIAPAWQPLTGKALAHAEAHIHEYKQWLNRKYKAGKLTKDECSHKLWQKEVEIGLRPPR